MDRNEIVGKFTSIAENNNTDVQEIENEIIGVVDYFESEINSALELLNSITSISDLSQVDECADKLRELSKDLY